MKKHEHNWKYLGYEFGRLDWCKICGIIRKRYVDNRGYTKCWYLKPGGPTFPRR